MQNFTIHKGTLEQAASLLESVLDSLMVIDSFEELYDSQVLVSIDNITYASDLTGVKGKPHLLTSTVTLNDGTVLAQVEFNPATLCSLSSIVSISEDEWLDAGKPYNYMVAKKVLESTHTVILS